jgi:glycosyltransferase involved in cell wall biosynthesis
VTICLIGTYNEEEVFRGPEKVARRIADQFSREGHRVFFYEYFSSGELYSYWKKLFGYERVKRSDLLFVSRVGLIPFVAVMISRRFDVVHIITFERFAALVILLKPLIRSTIVYSSHGIVQHQHIRFRPEMRRSLRIKDQVAELLFLKFSDRLFFLSERSVAIAAEYYKISSEKVVIVANGIDDPFFQIMRKGNDARKEVAVLLIGEPRRSEKGFEFFTRALGRCKSKFAVFVLCEELPRSPANTINNLQIHYVQKMASREYADFLASVDIYVSASSYDQFSIAAVEAMGSGLVPVVTKETGMSRYIDDGVNGFVIAHGEVERLAQTLDRLVGDEDLRKTLSSNARSTVTALRWKNIAQEYLVEYCLR